MKKQSKRQRIFKRRVEAQSILTRVEVEPGREGGANETSLNWVGSYRDQGLNNTVGAAIKSRSLPNLKQYDIQYRSGPNKVATGKAKLVKELRTSPNVEEQIQDATYKVFNVGNLGMLRSGVDLYSRNETQ